MKYYSETLHKFFDSEEECKQAEQIKAEEEQKKTQLSAERKERADEITKTYEDMCQLTKEYHTKLAELRTKYNEQISKFVKDYGSYHYSYRSNDVDDLDLLPGFELFNGFKSLIEPFSNFLLR